MRILPALLLCTLALPAFAAEKEKPKEKAPATEKSPAKTKIPRLSKQAIGECGVSVYAPEGFTTGMDPAKKSPDGATVYTVDKVVGDYHFGAICVTFTEGMPTDGEALEGVLVSYLDYLKGNLEITESAGYGKGHRLESVPSARGVIDYWKDEDGDEWKVKGWVTPTHLTALFVYGKGEYPIPNVREMYLDGFREP